MIKTIFGPLFFEKKESYCFQGTIEESIVKLKSNVKRSEFVTLFRQSVIGKISEEKVILWRYRPLWHNSFIPVFRGKFIIKEGKSVLEGEYSMHRFTKIFLYIFMAFVIFPLGVEIIQSYPRINNAQILNQVKMSGVMILFLIFIVHFGWFIGKYDIEYIEDNIKKSIYSLNSRTDR